MDVSSIASSFIAMQAAQLQTAAAAKMMKMNLQVDASVVKLLESAQSNATNAMNLAAGVGAQLDISV